jgi:hypothetical protein
LVAGSDAVVTLLVAYDAKRAAMRTAAESIATEKSKIMGKDTMPMLLAEPNIDAGFLHGNEDGQDDTGSWFGEWPQRHSGRKEAWRCAGGRG